MSWNGVLCAFFMDEKKIRNRERGTAAPPGANQRGWNRHPGVSLILYVFRCRYCQRKEIEAVTLGVSDTVFSDI